MSIDSRWTVDKSGHENEPNRPPHHGLRPHGLSLGIKPAKAAVQIGSRPNWFEAANVRIVLHGEDGIDVIGFDPAHGIGHAMAWDMHFRAGTPASIVLAPIKAAVL